MSWEFRIWVHFSKKSLFFMSSKQWGQLDLIPIAAVAVHVKQVRILQAKAQKAQVGVEPR